MNYVNFCSITDRQTDRGTKYIRRIIKNKEYPHTFIQQSFLNSSHEIHVSLFLSDGHIDL